MPYLRVEYSSNIKTEIELPKFLDRLHEAIGATGVFPQAGTRIRAYECRDYRVGDLDPRNAFVHATLEMGHGRNLETQKRAGEQIFAAMTEHLRPVFESRPMGISFQIYELHADLNFKLNNMHKPSAQAAG